MLNILEYKKHILAGIVLMCVSLLSHADIKLPTIFGSNMVLQRGKDIKIWGYADVGEKITISFNKQTKKVTANKEGKWSVLLKPEEAGGPHKLVIKGKTTVTLEDVLVGDVWVCAGQSNMEFAVSSAKNAEEEIKNANYPKIRHFEVKKAMSYVPKDTLEGQTKWQKTNPTNVGKFTAVGYFYARELQKDLNIPIGLIHTSWGGTDIETWISRTALENSDMFSSETNLETKQVDLEELIKQRKAQIVKEIKNIQGGFPDPLTIMQWKNPDYNDSKWPSIKIPGLWEQSIENFDGVVWFRKKITVLPEDAGKPALLKLSRIDDSDETYVNGVKVGEMKNKYNDKRSYPISGELIKEGENVIAVRIEDTGGGGGIYGSPEEVRLSIGGSKVISLASEWKYQVEKVFENSSTNTGNIGNPNDYPTLLFNAMVYPLTKLPIKGVIWYQGENNANRAYQYQTVFPLMINDWRTHWKLGDFPFYFVQLASWKAADGDSNVGSTWAELREAQSFALSLPNTGMAVTIDIGDRNDIHPKNKQEVGKRLSAIALNKTYKRNNSFIGPMMDTVVFDSNRAIVKFNHASSGFLIKDKYGYIKGFEIAGADKKFYYARAIVEGNDIVVSHDSVSIPVAVRYAWADDASDANLYNKEAFPTIPFRTDNWEGVTEGVRYNIR